MQCEKSYCQEIQIQLYFPSEANLYYFQQDSHDSTPCTSSGFSHLQRHSIFRPNSLQYTAQETSLHINPIYKVCSTHYRVCGSVTRNKALINWSSMKIAHYPQKLLASLQQSRDTNVEFGEDRLLVKPGKTLGVGRWQMEF